MHVPTQVWPYLKNVTHDSPTWRSVGPTPVIMQLWTLAVQLECAYANHDYTEMGFSKSVTVEYVQAFACTDLKHQLACTVYVRLYHIKPALDQYSIYIHHRTSHTNIKNPHLCMHSGGFRIPTSWLLSLILCTQNYRHFTAVGHIRRQHYECWQWATSMCFSIHKCCLPGWNSYILEMDENHDLTHI